ncbi:unnamed protein product [Caenorhabditis angaria]|uniref:Membrane transporter protein n=1 Tax=Caenorhabditis angaria TaxID=860376 RepID=A0A9P1I799_9PELO|nr:unnamed protein product [Caenorhabditis angaria]
MTFLVWCRKYLLEGQKLDEKYSEKLAHFPENPTISDYLLIKYRKFVAVLIPLCLVQSIWWSCAINFNLFPLYLDYWHMPVTMLLGSLIAGMTAEGASAVSFPVMTLILHLSPMIARDFALMIQSVGMTSSLVCVIFMKVKFEARAVVFGIIGAFPGFVFGIYCFDPLFTGSQKKMMFVSIWTAFAFALALLNSQKKRSTFMEIQEFGATKIVILMFVGFIGGVFDSFAGSGIDICIFSVITLYFRVSEKIATPTTMILKGVVSLFGFYYRAVLQGDISPISWNYFICCVPVASLMAPLGSFLGSHLHRQIVAGLIYVLEVLSLIGFYLTNPGWPLLIASGVIIAFGFAFFYIISKLGEKQMAQIEERQKPQKIATISNQV